MTETPVLIAGGGPAGLAAALVAGRAGARVLLADENRVVEPGRSDVDQDAELRARVACVVAGGVPGVVAPAEIEHVWSRVGEPDVNTDAGPPETTARPCFLVLMSAEVFPFRTEARKRSTSDLVSFATDFF